jgi:hypothetical protein
MGSIFANNVNGDETHKRVDLECADQDSSTDHVINADDLDQCANRSDSTDLYPIFGNDDFCLSTYTTPSSIDYDGIETILGVFNVGQPETIMTANLWIAPEFVNDTVRFPWGDFGPGGLSISTHISVTHEATVSHFLPFCGRGVPMHTFATPGSNPSGLAYADELLWNSDVGTAMIYELDPATGDVLRDFGAPGPAPRDLAWDGLTLWCVDSDLEMIHQIDPVTGGVIHGFQTPGAMPYGLTWIDGKLWCTDSGTDLLYELLTDGSIVRTLPSPGPAPCGLGSDGSILWVADSDTDMLYPIEVGPTAVEEATTAPLAYDDFKGAPNPFRGTATFSYAVRTKDAHVTLAIFDVSGALVRTLVDDPKSPGTHIATWDGRDDVGQKMPSGVYFSKLEAGEFQTVRKVMLLR